MYSLDLSSPKISFVSINKHTSGTFGTCHLSNKTSDISVNIHGISEHGNRIKIIISRTIIGATSSHEKYEANVQFGSVKNIQCVIYD